MDNSEITISNRQICCRLCLAPDNECVPIFTNSAADKEPLSSKIQACVNIKVHDTDRLSSRICHYCISYLNSWQSFKNRCLAAQKKQRTWLFLLSEKEKLQRQHAATQAAAIARRQLQHQLQRNLLNFVANKDSGGGDGGGGIQNEVQEEERSNTTKNTNHQTITNSNNNDDLDLSCVKEEPQEMISDDEEHNNMNVELDPSQFLANNEDDDDYPAYDEPVPAPIMSMEEGPPILTSLGLTHVNHVNSCNFVKNEPDYGDDLTNPGDMYNSFNDQKLGGPIPGACSICDMKFSNRANARRHERNIHGILPNPITFSTPQLSNTISLNNPAAIKPIISRKVIHVPEVYNYETPEKYRQYLTENKIKFICNNLTFLEQYQDMICACCDRQYQTYKAFMSHMRKKYQFLPRNLCFKCLKQFETKGQFIAHLKKRNCLNLYRLYMIDESIAKPELTEEEKARNKTKDILANKDYGCKLCGQTFKLKMDFRAHVFEQHADNQKGNEQSLTVCGFCNVKFEDAATKKRHYTNLECIISIICLSCGQKFTQHPLYIDHVYTNHLSNANANDFNEADSYDGDFEAYQSTSRLRTPQNCAVCGKQYNNYYNVLRHMESKHPDQLPQTYSCEHCQTGFPRQSELREHIKLNHRDSIFRTPTSSANVSLSGGVKQPPIISCNDCGLVCETRDVWIEHMTTHSKFVCPQCEFKTESKDEYNNHLSTHLKFKLYSCVICKHSFNNEKGLDLHMKTIHNQSTDGNESENNKHNSDEYKANNMLSVEVKQEIMDEMDVSNNDNDNDDDIDNNTVEENSNMGDSIQPSDNDNTNGGTQSPPKQRECPICKSIFNAGVSFSNHMRTHMVSSPHQNFLRTLNVSGQPIVKPSRMRCRLCQKRINTKLGLKRHMLLAHQIRDYTCVKCYMCPAEFSSHKGLRVHLLKSHQITKPEEDSSTVDGGGRVQIKTEKMANNYECHICHIVYKNKDDLKNHCSSVHGFELPTDDVDSKDNLMDEDTLNETNEESCESDYWYQCRYCVDTFNSGKQLTIHMNTHEEQYPTDYSCKDCGNVYNTRKSLWVHRYNKHPRPPNPTVCEICKKIFFDKTELFYHLKTHTQSTNSASQPSNLKFSSPSTINQTGKYSCHVCGQKFYEKGPLSKHIKMHELENNSFGGNPLMSMFDDGGSTSGGQNNNGNDYDSGNDFKLQFQEQIRMVNGEYACDLCPKTFPILNALHVHRGWHFRSPSGRQVTDPSQTWQPDSIPPSKLRRMRNPYGQPPTCPYCNSTFASTNNLRRHIVEVHKRNEAKLMRESGNDNAGFYVEKLKQCRSCNMSFSTTTEWIDHKIVHARNQKPSTTFEWGCEICGKMFTRKERLLQHMITHLNSREFDEDGTFSNTGGDATNENSMEPSQMGSELNFESNSQSSQSSMSSSSNEQNNDEQNDDNYDQDEMMSEADNSELPEASLSCELCQKMFTSTAALREHISNHILNGNLQSDPTESSKKSNEQEIQQSSNNFCQISNMF